VRSTASCAGVGPTSSASSPKGSSSTFIRPMSGSCSRSSASRISVRGPVIRLKVSGSSKLKKNFPRALISTDWAEDDAGRNLV
jgi:hypothetical protein